MDAYKKAKDACERVEEIVEIMVYLASFCIIAFVSFKVWYTSGKAWNNWEIALANYWKATADWEEACGACKQPIDALKKAKQAEDEWKIALKAYIDYLDDYEKSIDAYDKKAKDDDERIRAFTKILANNLESTQGIWQSVKNRDFVNAGLGVVYPPLVNMMIFILEILIGVATVQLQMMTKKVGNAETNYRKALNVWKKIRHDYAILACREKLNDLQQTENVDMKDIGNIIANYLPLTEVNEEAHAETERQ